MGPWQKIPDVYRPNWKTRHFPHLLELGIGVNEAEMRQFAKFIGADHQASETEIINAVKLYCTKHSQMPPRAPNISYRLLAYYPEAHHGFCIINSYDLASFNPDDFHPAFLRMQEMWQKAGINKKTMWHLSAFNSRPREERKVSSLQKLVFGHC